MEEGQAEGVRESRGVERSAFGDTTTGEGIVEGGATFAPRYKKVP